MRPSWHGFIVTGALLACTGIADGAASKQLEATFQEQLIDIQQHQAESRVRLEGEYKQALDRLQQELQEAALLDALVTVRDETDRFARERTVGPADLVSAPVALLGVQNSFLAAEDRISVTRARSIRELAGFYTKTLQREIDRLTRTGDVDGALALRTVQAGLPRRQVVADAERILKAYDLQQAALAPPKPDPAEPTGALLPAEPETANLFQGSDRRRIGDRYEELTQHILDSNWAATSAYVNPRRIEREGAQWTELRFKLLQPWLQLARAAQARLTPGEIDVDETGEHAVQIPVIRGPNWRKKGDPATWIKVDGDWYLEFKKETK